MWILGDILLWSTDEKSNHTDHKNLKRHFSFEPEENEEVFDES